MPVDHFGEPVARRYDEDEAARFDPAELEPTVGFLAAAAGGGPALELGIGTGRVALPLAARGIDVHGIDLSPAMVARMRAKPGGDAIPITIGDFATVRAPGRFSLVYLVFNTIGNLTTQDAQVDCFRNAAGHLTVGGRFIVEVALPQLRRLPPGETLVADDVRRGHLGVDEYDVVGQGLVSHHVTLADGRWERSSIPLRYVWPAELDLMARLAGMVLRERWGGWDRSPLTADSARHVSVWERVAEPAD